MRVRTVVLTALAIVAVAASQTGCTKSRGNPGPSVTPSVSAAPSPSHAVPGFVFSGVSVQQVMDAVKKEFGLTGVVEYVPKGSQSKPCIGGAVVSGDNSGTFFQCDDGRFAVPEALGDALRGEQPLTVWYVLAFNAAKFQKGYEATGSEICAAGHVVRGSPLYSTVTLANLKAFVRTQGTGADAFLQAGVDAADSGKPISACKGG